MNSAEKPILVTGATGAQGGATARALLSEGRKIRILTRDPDKPAARILSDKGAEVVKGDMDDASSVHAAMAGAGGVFSVQMPAMPGTDNERKHGFLLVEAALKANVPQFVHTSVAATGRRTSFPKWGTGYWSEKYWTDKWEIEEAVRTAGFDYWTVLKPAFMVDNFIPPKAGHMFPHLRQGQILSALHRDTKMQLIAAEDVGKFACAAFLEPARFHGENIELASEALTMDEVARVLSRVLDKKISAVSVSPDEAVEKGLFPGWVRSQEWSNLVSYGADIAGLEKYGIPLQTLESWADKHKSRFEVDA